MVIDSESYQKLMDDLAIFRKNAKYRLYGNLILIILIIILFIGVCNRISSLKTDLLISKQNEKALSDSIRYSKNKIGNLEASINVLITEKGKLNKLNTELAAELKKEKGKVYELNQFIIELQNKPHDTIYIPNEIIIYPNGVYGLKWKYDTTFNSKNSRFIEGESKFKIINSTVEPLHTKISQDKIRFNLITGLREKDGNIEIFARSDYPNLTITDMEGAIIDPKNNPVIKKFTKPKRIGVGPYFGFGVSADMKIGLQVGIGFSYSLIRF